MDLNTIWFILVAVLFIGFFFLEGFDYGVGTLLPFLGKDDTERRMIINTIGSFWDGNEVWVLTAGGAIFAAFPNWYATMFSGFYLALLLMLLVLIARGVAFEFRSKHDAPRWRSLWDWAIFVGSAVPALLWGVAVGNLVRGVPIDADMNFTGNFFSLLSVYTIVFGLAVFGIFLLHGAIFLALKAGDPVGERAHKFAATVAWPVLGVVLVAVVLTYFQTDIFTRLGVNPGITAIGAGLALIATGLLLGAKRDGWAFITTGLAIALTVITVFRGLYPRVMISSLNEAWDLTIYNASSSPYTLKTMTIVALIFVPIVLLYQGWSYHVFRERVTKGSRMEY